MNPKPDPVLGSRKRPHPHMPRGRHNQACILLATVCANGRKKLFARQSALDTILAAWRANTAWTVGRYVFMPDHIHFFCAPAGLEQPAFAPWMKQWKSHASRNWPAPGEQPIWQFGHWDRQLRDPAHYDSRWEYVRQNPVRAGLCADAGDWPWQGEIERLLL